ncbi:MAG TPA: 30S ribosomal protein S8 [Planctomycetaceae bacterium]|nr:30S ribosomal protein S8 [Planctomycetaceae bacterium]
MMTDPVADMLTRVRNALQNESPFVDMPTSKLKVGIAEVLQREGYIWDFAIIEGKPASTLRVNLKYGPNGERVIQNLRRISSPGCRVYSAATDFPVVLQGLGICIISTNKGLLSSREAKQQKVGGEVLCTVW